MGYNEGVQIGQSLGGDNPFSVIVGRVKQAQERKKEDEKDLRELQQLFTTMGIKYDYDKKLQDQKDQENDDEIPDEDEESVNFKGTPFETVAGRKKVIQRNDITPSKALDMLTDPFKSKELGKKFPNKFKELKQIAGIQEESDNLPDVSKYKEGSILKVDGQPKFKKVQGQWQPIQ